MKKIRFFKYHGTGNDFIMIDNREQKLIFENFESVARLCHRRFGIGADGLILIEESGMFDFRMKYYNSDGRIGSMCGNGGRCAVAFASYLGIISDHTSFEASDGIHEGSVLDQHDNRSTITLRMQDVHRIERLASDYILDTGSPHYVKIVESSLQTDVVTEGRKIRYSEMFKENGINVNYVSVNNGLFNLRTYERGVEDETWSCGTGSVATAIALELEGKNKFGEPVELITPGGKLTVSFNRNGDKFSNIYLTGATERVYEGLIQLL